MLCDVATRGPWVSAHPDVIIKMGVKEVLYRTKHLGWGTDTHLYQSMAEFLATFPRRLRTHGPLVIKQNRGNGGQGVWKVELIDGAPSEASRVRVLHAQRGSMPLQLNSRRIHRALQTVFPSAGCIIDQPFQPRLVHSPPILQVLRKPIIRATRPRPASLPKTTIIYHKTAIFRQIN